MPTQQALSAADRPAPNPTPSIPPRRSGRVEELERQLDRLHTHMRIAVVYGGVAFEQAHLIRACHAFRWAGRYLGQFGHHAGIFAPRLRHKLRRLA